MRASRAISRRREPTLSLKSVLGTLKVTRRPRLPVDSIETCMDAPACRAVLRPDVVGCSEPATRTGKPVIFTDFRALRHSGEYGRATLRANAKVAELVDALVLGTSAARRAG